MSSAFQSSKGQASEAARIADQLKRVYKGPAWLGPALGDILSDVTAEQASRRAIGNAHTIWELVLHIAAWMRIGRERLAATTTRDHTDDENWPRVVGSWQDALATLEREERQLEQAILQFPDERLDEPAPATEPQTFYELLHGIVQHTAYHGGQIAVLKK
ncbi:MAG: DinB family protein [Bryobacteraceae bacterium]